MSRFDEIRNGLDRELEKLGAGLRLDAGICWFVPEMQTPKNQHKAHRLVEQFDAEYLKTIEEIGMDCEEFARHSDNFGTFMEERRSLITLEPNKSVIFLAMENHVNGCKNCLSLLRRNWKIVPEMSGTIVLGFRQEVA